jgi:16S rRNA (cytosine967-C5)-methyltransferase
MVAEKPRQIAVRVLRRHAAGVGWLENLLEAELVPGTFAPLDRALVQELCFGVVRWQAALDWLIARKTAGRTQNTVLQILLRLGLYQLFWLDRIPDHAAVHESVQLARELGFGPKAGFVNALLRGCLRERDSLERELAALKDREPHLGCSHPQWLCTRWEQRWGREKLRALLDWNNTPPPVFIRVNTLKTTAGKLSQQFEAEGVLFTPRPFDWAPPDFVFELRSHPSLASLPSFQQGFFYVQDPSTLLAVHELNPQPGESVLDLCAAPGGKTTFIAQLMRNEGIVLAQDADRERLKLVRENCDRLGVTCVTIGTASSTPAIGTTEQRLEHRAPARHELGVLQRAEQELGAPSPRQSEEQFDRILVDAPCSNTGVMRRRVDLRWRIQPAEIERLGRVQLELLSQAGALLKPGGTLVYSTCSLEPEENGRVVQEFLAGRKEFRLDSERALIPFADAVDGAYVAKLLRD